MQHSRLVQVAQSCEVILSHEDVWVTEERQSAAFGVDFVFQLLGGKNVGISPKSESVTVMSKSLNVGVLM